MMNNLSTEMRDGRVFARTVTTESFATASMQINKQHRSNAWKFASLCEWLRLKNSQRTLKLDDEVTMRLDELDNDPFRRKQL